MKKTYKNPVLTVVKIQPAQFIATSNMTMMGDYDSGTVTIGSRESSFSDWGDDESMNIDF